MRMIPRAVVVVIMTAALGLADARCSFSEPMVADTKTIEEIVYRGPVRHYTEKSVTEAADDATMFSVSHQPVFTFSSSESAEFYQPTTGAGTLTPLTFDVSFEK